MVTQFMNKGKAVNNHFVIALGKNVFLQSYTTLVVKIADCDKVTLSSKWDFSPTTCKYVCRFLVQNGFCYTNKRLVKAAIKSGAINVVDKLTA